jgi:hypothetical protein
MATVRLRHLWVHDADDLSDHVKIDTDRVEVSPAQDVQFHARANGTVTASTVPVRTRTVSAKGWLSDDSVWRWLDVRVGRPVFVRTPDGEAWWAVFAGLPVESRDAGRQVTFAATQVRHG